MVVFVRQRARRPYPKRSPQQWRALKREAVMQFAGKHCLGAGAEALEVSYEAVRVWYHKWPAGGAETASPPPRESRHCQ